jgi:hypothetical protein
MMNMVTYQKMKKLIPVIIRSDLLWDGTENKKR